jgi:hypothetical protein
MRRAPNFVLFLGRATEDNRGLTKVEAYADGPTVGMQERRPTLFAGRSMLRVSAVSATLASQFAGGRSGRRPEALGLF